MNTEPSLDAGTFLTAQLADRQTQWSLGTFGALAEFMRDPDEACVETDCGEAISIATPRGGIHLKLSAAIPIIRLRIDNTHQLGPPRIAVLAGK